MRGALADSFSLSAKFFLALVIIRAPTATGWRRSEDPPSAFAAKRANDANEGSDAA